MPAHGRDKGLLINYVLRMKRNNRAGRNLLLEIDMKTGRISFSANKMIAAGLMCAGCAAGPAAFAQADAGHASLSAEWWQWALSIPGSVNPLLDTSGTSCMVGQHGSVWFLAGYFGDNANPMSRDCAVPADRTLFFPVANSINFDTPNVCGQDSSPIDVSILRANSADAISHVAKSSLSVTLDGVAVRTVRRIRSPVFAVALPEQSLFTPLCTGQPGGLPGKVYSPAVDEGYYVTIESLRNGHHTLHFSANNDSGQVIQDMTYHLNVGSPTPP